MSVLKILSVALMVLPLPVKAQTISGNALLEICQSDALVQRGYCIGYVDGVRDGLIGGSANTFLALGGSYENASQLNRVVNDSLMMCIPEEATSKQLVDVFVQYGQANASERHYPGRFLIMQAFRSAFPCN